MTLGTHIVKYIDTAAAELGIDITQEQFEERYAKAREMRKKDEAEREETRKAARLEKVLAQTEKLKAQEGKKSAPKKQTEKSALATELEAAEAALKELKEDAEPKKKRASSAWCKFRTANKGQGMSQEEMKEAFNALSEEELGEFK